MDENIKQKLSQPFDRVLVKKRIGPGGKILSYVAIGDYLSRLNDVFGCAWDLEITEVRVLDEEVIVQVRLTVPGGTVKMAIGGAAITRRRDNGKPVSIAHDLMSAEATALKRAARLLGVGASLYDDDEVEDAQRPDRERPPAPPPSTDSPRITSAQLSKLRSLVADWTSYRAEVRERHGVNLEFATRKLASELIDELVRANGAEPRNSNGHSNGHRGHGYQAGGWRRT